MGQTKKFILVIVLAGVLTAFLSRDFYAEPRIVSVQEAAAIARLESQQNFTQDIMNNPASIFELKQSHFTNGSVIIDDDYVIATDDSGITQKTEIDTDNMVFRLMEDISFNPNKSSDTFPPHLSGYVQPQQYQYYDPQAFGIGFFAAIVIQADNIVLDLNDYTLEQSREHSIQQRFYANIELADQPFVPEQGPADFGEDITSAENVSIINGRLGKSSHHGIHGQLPTNILVQDVVIEQFEVAGISLHGAQDISIANVDINGQDPDVEMLGLWSSLRFIQPYVEAVPDGSSITVNDQQVDKASILSSLNTINDAVVRDASAINDYPYLINESGFTDGNVYGLVINHKGVAVNGMPNTYKSEDASDKILIKDVTIQNLSVDIQEIPALSPDNTMAGGAQTDTVGAVFQTHLLVGDDGQFTGSLEDAPIQLAQLLVADAVLSDTPLGRLPVDRSTITDDVIDWVAGGQTFAEANLRYSLNGDSMHHVNKGIIGAKIDGSSNVVIDNLTISDIANVSGESMTFDQIPFYPSLTEDEIAYDNGEIIGIKHGTDKGAGMNEARGISFSSSQDIQMYDSSLTYVTSLYGPSYGVDVLYDSRNISGLQNVFSAIDGYTQASEDSVKPSLDIRIKDAVSGTISFD